VAGAGVEEDEDPAVLCGGPFAQADLVIGDAEGMEALD